LNATNKPRVLLFIEKEVGDLVFEKIYSNPSLEIVGVVTNKSKANWWGSNRIWETIKASRSTLLLAAEDRLTMDDVSSIVDLDFDVLLSIQYRWRIPTEILDRCDLKFNLHLSPLPYYQGHSVFAHAILDDCKFYGVTLHELTPEFDRGRILYQELFLVSESETAFSLYEKSVRLGVDLVQRFVSNLLNGKRIVLTPQIEGGAFYDKHSLNERLKTLESQGQNSELLSRALYFPKVQEYLKNL
jgi:methionyl-tRNA formyltransferase